MELTCYGGRILALITARNQPTPPTLPPYPEKFREQTSENRPPRTDLREQTVERARNERTPKDLAFEPTQTTIRNWLKQADPDEGKTAEGLPLRGNPLRRAVQGRRGSFLNGFGWPMGSVGDCYLGALCESFFPTLECELIEQETFADRSEARRSIFRFTEGFCNQVHRGLLQPRSTPLHHRRPLAGRLRGRVPFTRSR
jgi:hypothetical protein